VSWVLIVFIFSGLIEATEGHTKESCEISREIELERTDVIGAVCTFNGGESS